MVAVFSVFATLSLIDLKILGVGMAAAVLIDATVVRGILLPAALALLGERAWPSLAPPPAPENLLRSNLPVISRGSLQAKMCRAKLIRMWHRATRYSARPARGSSHGLDGSTRSGATR
jgi:hypothetical protein